MRRSPPAPVPHRRDGALRVALALALTLALALALAPAVSCSVAFTEVHLSEPAVVQAPDALRVQARRIFLTEDVLAGGVREDTALAVELDVTNAGAAVHDVSVASLSCLMELDPAARGQTLSLPLGAGGDGTFPGEGAGDSLLVRGIPIPPGKTQTLWALFRGYRFAGSDVPRRVVVTIPGADGRPMRLGLADPGRGQSRWLVPAQRSSIMLGIENTSLLGGRTKAMGVATEITLFRPLGRLLLDTSLSSLLLVQSQGSLTSPTSSFAGTGVNAHLALPVVTWGPELDPRRFGLYAGGQAQLLISVDPPPPSGQAPSPHVYGAFAAEGGLELEVGALQPARTPFPLTAVGPTLPRWFLRAGYTHWWIGGGGADGYTSSVRLAW